MENQNTVYVLYMESIEG